MYFYYDWVHSSFMNEINVMIFPKFIVLKAHACFLVVHFHSFKKETKNRSLGLF